MDSLSLTTLRDVGGWVFATFTIATGAWLIIRWLMRLLDRNTAAIDRIASAVNGLTEEVRAARRR